MINAKELRIGNKITERGNHRIYEVTKILLDSVAVIYWSCGASEEINYNKLMPIPLTPEILESCGFKYDSDEMGDSLAEFYINGDFIWSKGLKEMYFKHTPLPHIEYLHQLQNLYFAITGQELKVNINVAVNQ